MTRRLPFHHGTLHALCAVVAQDTWQRAHWRAIHELRAHEYGPPNAASVAVQRMLLRALYPGAHDKA